MKDIVNKLNKQFESRVRLGIMSVLMVNDSVEFNTLKDTLGLTDGNLASHLASLEKNDMIKVEKTFKGRKPNTSYMATELGKRAFKEHLKILESFLNNNK